MLWSLIFFSRSCFLSTKCIELDLLAMRPNLCVYLFWRGFFVAGFGVFLWLLILVQDALNNERIVSEWPFHHISTRTVVTYEIFLRYVGLLGIIIGQFKLERTKPDAFFFISPIHRNSSGNGKDYQDAFSLSRNNLFSLYIHVGQRKHHLCLKFLKVFFSQMIQGEKYLTSNLVHSHWKDRTPFFLLCYTQENYCNFCNKEAQLMCRDRKHLLLDNQK